MIQDMGIDGEMIYQWFKEHDDKLADSRYLILPNLETGREISHTQQLDISTIVSNHILALWKEKIPQEDKEEMYYFNFHFFPIIIPPPTHIVY